MIVDICTPDGRWDHRTRVSPEQASELLAMVESLPGWRIFIH
jgi:hypothetical protein